MKRFLALLLVVALTACFAVVASAEDKTYTDKVNLLPTDASKVQQGADWTDGEGVTHENVAVFKIEADGSLVLSRSEEKRTPATLVWPSIIYDVNQEIDLAATPYVHMKFESQGIGVNGHIYYTVDGGTEEKTIQISQFGKGDVNDYQENQDLYLPFSKVEATAKKITVTRVDLCVSGAEGATITWRAFAFAKEGADEPDQDDGKDDPNPDEGKDDDKTPGSDSAGSDTTPADSGSTTPGTGDTGVLVFAVMGVVAVAGVAVAVKTRR